MELKRYLEIVWRRKWILIVTAVVVPLFAYVMMKIIPPMYKSEAKLWTKMNTLQQKYLKDMDATVGKLEFSDAANALGTMEEILNNSESINLVITEMGLTNRKGEKFTPDEFTNPNKISLMLHLQTKGYSEEQITDSDVIKITGYSTSPAEAYAIADRVVKGFISTFTEMYKRAAILARKTLLKRLDDVDRKLVDAMRTLELYKAKNEIYNLANQITTLMSEKSALESDRDKAVRSLEGAKSDLKKIDDASLIDQNGIKDVIVKIETSTVLDNYKTQLLNLETEQARLSVEKTGEHPDIKVRKQEIELVKDRIRNEIARSFPSQVMGRDSFFDRISERYSGSLFTVIESTVTIKLLDEQINERTKALRKLPEMERELNKLQWDIDILKTTRDALKSNYETAKSADYMDLSNPFVIQPPTLFKSAKDNQYFPPTKKKVALAIATFLGLFFGLFIVFFVEYWSSDIPDSRDGAKKTDQDDNVVNS